MSKNKKLSSLSIFFPCFNEAKSIPILIKQADAVANKLAKKYEILVIDDGSQDDTVKVVNNLRSKYANLKLVQHENNKGYGAALQSGFKASQYKWIFFTDGDLQFDISELESFIPFVDDYHVIIGYRRKRAEGTIRAFNARLFKLYIDLLFRVHVKDIDCAFKLFKAETIKSIELFSQGAFISSEFLYKLKKQGVEFKQLPVHHYPRQHGQPTGANLKVIIKGVTDALRLYLKMKFKLQRR